MARTKKASRRRRRNYTRHHHRRANARYNPRRRRRYNRRRNVRHYRRHYRRNAGISFGGLGNTLVTAGWAAAGGIGSRALTQLVLQSANVGILGYGANLVSGLLLAWGTGAVLKNSKARNDIILGTVLGIIFRAVQDYTPLGKYASMSGLGDFLTTSFFMPRVLMDPRSGVIQMPAQLTAAANPKAGMGAFYQRQAYRR